jgi:hypothetical protein
MRNLHRFALAALVLTLPACASIRPATRSVGGAPESFVRLTTEAQSSRMIAVPPALKNAGAWRALSEFLSDRYTVAARDQEAGFAMTAWQATLSREGVPDLRYRTRLVFTFLGEDWTQLHVRAEANWRQGDQWQVGYDRELLDRVAAELQAKLGG